MDLVISVFAYFCRIEAYDICFWLRLVICHDDIFFLFKFWICSNSDCSCCLLICQENSPMKIGSISMIIKATRIIAINAIPADSAFSSELLSSFWILASFEALTGEKLFLSAMSYLRPQIQILQNEIVYLIRYIFI